MDGFCGNVPYSIVERKNNDKNPVCNCKLKHAMEEIMKVQSWRIELMQKLPRWTVVQLQTDLPKAGTQQMLNRYKVDSGREQISMPSLQGARSHLRPSLLMDSGCHQSAYFFSWRPLSLSCFCLIRLGESQAHSHVCLLGDGFLAPLQGQGPEARQGHYGQGVRSLPQVTVKADPLVRSLETFICLQEK